MSLKVKGVFFLFKMHESNVGYELLKHKGEMVEIPPITFEISWPIFPLEHWNSIKAIINQQIRGLNLQSRASICCD